jgi:hypothetical protein
VGEAEARRRGIAIGRDDEQAAGASGGDQAELSGARS